MTMEVGFSGLSRSRGPGAVGLMQDFLNTIDIESETDLVETPAALAGWLQGRGLLGPGATVSAREHARVLELRETASRRPRGDDPRREPEDAYARLDGIAADVPLRVRFGAATRLEPVRRRAAPAIGPILATVYDAPRRRAVERLKVCRNDACRWAFYDPSRNRSGVWCTMAICGNRMKGRVLTGSRHAADRVRIGAMPDQRTRRFATSWPTASPRSPCNRPESLNALNAAMRARAAERRQGRGARRGGARGGPHRRGPRLLQRAPTCAEGAASATSVAS